MTIATTNRIGSPNGAPPPPAPPPPSGAASGSFNTIDPIRLLRKYRSWLVVAMIVGAGLGAAGHFILREVYPIFRSAAIFRVYPPRADVTEGTPTGDEEELQIFMATEAQIMVSEPILQKAMEDPGVPRQAQTWARRFTKSGRFSPIDAAIELEKKISARPISGTAFVRLSMGYTDREEVASLVGFVREAYLRDLTRRGGEFTAQEIEALDRSIKDLTDEIGRLQADRDRLAAENELDALDVRASATRSELDLLRSQVVVVRTDLVLYATQLQEMQLQLARPGGIEYSDTLRDGVIAMPIMQSLQAQITGLQTQRRVALERLGPEHREIRSYDNTILALQQQYEQEMQRLLRERFEVMLTVYEDYIKTLQAQDADLQQQLEELSRKLNQLVVVQNQLVDIENLIEQNTELLTDYQIRRKSLETMTRLDISDRIVLHAQERIPEVMAFPKLYIMVPAGIFLIGGLFAGAIVLFETIDQRVKSPADVAFMAGARVLGVIPHAAEDPSPVKALETAYRDHPAGVTAECYRQTRAIMLKQLRQSGARSVAIIPAMPGSGASTVAANLAQAFAASDLKTLLIDANFRRPRQHAIFGADEAPGLTDVISGVRRLDEAVRPSGFDGLDLLTAGAPDPRRQERLATDAMARLIAAASEAYDYVIIDTAPIVVSGDAISMANKVDATVLVTRAYSEKRGMISRVLRELHEQPAETLGVIVNGVRSAAGGYLRRNIIATHKYQNAAGKA
ncbi:MAG: polysaccharide biosynthesis tyrosine autokinase [Phycisphaerales bacterium JB039]